MNRPRPRTFQSTQHFRRVNSFEEFQKLETYIAPGNAANPGTPSNDQLNNPHSTSSQLPIAPQPKHLLQQQQHEAATTTSTNNNNAEQPSKSTKTAISTQSYSIEPSKPTRGFSYYRLRREMSLPKPDSYELNNNDLKFLESFNAKYPQSPQSLAAAETTATEPAAPPSKQQDSAWMVRLIEHFENKSTRMTTATKEEILLELPSEFNLENLSREGLFEMYEYWRAERENEVYYRMGSEPSSGGGHHHLKNIYPFLRRYWRATANEEEDSHAVFQTREILKVVTRKSSRPETVRGISSKVSRLSNAQEQNKEQQDKVLALFVDFKRHKELALNVKRRENLKKDLAFLEIHEFNASIPGLANAFKIHNTFMPCPNGPASKLFKQLNGKLNKSKAKALKNSAIESQKQQAQQALLQKAEEEENQLQEKQTIAAAISPPLTIASAIIPEESSQSQFVFKIQIPKSSLSSIKPETETNAVSNEQQQQQQQIQSTQKLNPITKTKRSKKATINTIKLPPLQTTTTSVPAVAAAPEQSLFLPDPVLSNFNQNQNDNQPDDLLGEVEATAAPPVPGGSILDTDAVAEEGAAASAAPKQTEAETVVIKKKRAPRKSKPAAFVPEPTTTIQEEEMQQTSQQIQLPQQSNDVDPLTNQMPMSSHYETPSNAGIAPQPQPQQPPVNKRRRKPIKPLSSAAAPISTSEILAEQQSSNPPTAAIFQAPLAVSTNNIPAAPIQDSQVNAAGSTAAAAVQQQQQLIQLCSESESASFIANLLGFFKQLVPQLPITLDNADSLEEIKAKKEEMVLDSKLKIKNPNMFAYHVRRRLGRSNRELIDRVISNPADVYGTQAGRITYLLTPENTMIYNSYNFANPEMLNREYNLDSSQKSRQQRQLLLQQQQQSRLLQKQNQQSSMNNNNNTANQFSVADSSSPQQTTAATGNTFEEESSFTAVHLSQQSKKKKLKKDVMDTPTNSSIVVKSNMSAKTTYGTNSTIQTAQTDRKQQQQESFSNKLNESTLAYLQEKREQITQRWNNSNTQLQLNSLINRKRKLPSGFPLTQSDNECDSDDEDDDQSSGTYHNNNPVDESIDSREKAVEVNKIILTQQNKNKIHLGKVEKEKPSNGTTTTQFWNSISNIKLRMQERLKKEIPEEGMMELESDSKLLVQTNLNENNPSNEIKSSTMMVENQDSEIDYLIDFDNSSQGIQRITSDVVFKEEVYQQIIPIHQQEQQQQIRDLMNDENAEIKLMENDNSTNQENSKIPIIHEQEEPQNTHKQDEPQLWKVTEQANEINEQPIPAEEQTHEEQPYENNQQSNNKQMELEQNGLNPSLPPSQSIIDDPSDLQQTQNKQSFEQQNSSSSKQQQEMEIIQEMLLMNPSVQTHELASQKELLIEQSQANDETEAVVILSASAQEPEPELDAQSKLNMSNSEINFNSQTPKNLNGQLVQDLIVAPACSEFNQQLDPINEETNQLQEIS